MLGEFPSSCTLLVSPKFQHVIRQHKSPAPENSMKLKTIKITPIAFRDPPLLNAAGIHEPFALRTIIELESDTGHIGLGETYGDAPVIELLEALRPTLVGLDPFDLNGLRARVHQVVASTRISGNTAYLLAPGTDPRKNVQKLYSALEVAL